MQTTWELVRESIDDVRRQWQAFRRGHGAGPQVRVPIYQSWQRCLAAGVPDKEPGGRLAGSDAWLASLRDEHRDLLDAAAPVLAELKSALAGTGQVLALCDSQARALLIEGDPTARRAAERINLVPGSDWSEPVSGTNAMGTALAEAGGVTVFATEHYLENLHPWGCVAAPIRHPITGQPMGVLDLSGREMVVNHHTELAVQGAVRAIQARIAAREAHLHELLLAALADQIAAHRPAGLGALDRHGLLLRFAGLTPPRQRTDPGWALSMERLLATGDEITELLEREDAQRLKLTYRPVHHDGRIIGALVEAGRPTDSARQPRRPESPLPGLVGTDPRWLATAERAAKGARTDSTILLTGETGTGKEVMARAIHGASPRAHGPFVAINCGALPPNLAASELFGYVAGAFTGANPRGRAGAFEAAQGGTLFLDEVSDLSPESQVALLRVLQEREVVRIGAHQPVKVNVRVIAASNRELATLVAQGQFRQDLYFRLNVFPVNLPSLRERPQDIVPLIEHGYRRLEQEPPALPPASWQRLVHYRWPGNVRELLNLVEQAVALHEDPAALLPLPALPCTPVLEPGEPEEAELIRQALDQHQGNAAAAARALRMGRSTLYRKLELYGIRLKRAIE